MAGEDHTLGALLPVSAELGGVSWLSRLLGLWPCTNDSICKYSAGGTEERVVWGRRRRLAVCGSIGSEFFLHICGFTGLLKNVSGSAEVVEDKSQTSRGEVEVQLSKVGGPCRNVVVGGGGSPAHTGIRKPTPGSVIFK
jgi:hypothetical protein